MNNVNKTLYIPLYGKAYVSKKKIILNDPKAEEIWSAEGFKLKGKSKSKWLAYYMGMRSAVFDQWLCKQMDMEKDAVIVHIGCGMDSRIERIGTRNHLWFDVDFPDVIEERKRYYRETADYHMIESDARENNWITALPKNKPAILEENTGITFVKEHDMTLDNLINQLKGMEKAVFKKIFGGKISKKMYRLYEYKKDID